MYTKIFTIGLLFLFACSTTEAQPETISGEDVINEMYERYHDLWYDHLTFEQETIFYKNGEEERRQMWFEALSVPGRLVIKFDSLNSGTGIMFRQDTQYVFQENKLVQQAPRVHDLLVLGFDVYKQDPKTSVEELQGQGFDLSKTYQAEWQERPVIVVGASDKSDKSNQFWIDKERLYFVRLLKENSQNGVVTDTRFNKYEKIGGGWVAPEVLFYSDGQLVLEEFYSKMKVHDDMDPLIFDLENFREATW